MARWAPTKGSSRLSPNTAMLSAPFGCTHPPPPAPPSLLAQSLSPKDIAGSLTSLMKSHAVCRRFTLYTLWSAPFNCIITVVPYLTINSSHNCIFKPDMDLLPSLVTTCDHHRCSDVQGGLDYGQQVHSVSLSPGFIACESSFSGCLMQYHQNKQLTPISWLQPLSSKTVFLNTSSAGLLNSLDWTTVLTVNLFIAMSGSTVL